MANRQNPQLPLDIGAPTGRGRRYCRQCHRPLTDPASRLIGYGPDCDPERRPGATPEHHIDQDALPGTE